MSQASLPFSSVSKYNGNCWGRAWQFPDSFQSHSSDFLQLVLINMGEIIEIIRGRALTFKKQQTKLSAASACSPFGQTLRIWDVSNITAFRSSLHVAFPNLSSCLGCVYFLQTFQSLRSLFQLRELGMSNKESSNICAAATRKRGSNLFSKALRARQEVMDESLTNRDPT